MINKNIETLNQILAGKHISPVYQPIVSLVDGHVYAYEALSRISNPELKMDIEEMFATADDANKSWELEALCRTGFCIAQQFILPSCQSLQKSELWHSNRRCRFWILRSKCYN